MPENTFEKDKNFAIEYIKLCKKYNRCLEGEVNCQYGSLHITNPEEDYYDYIRSLVV